MRQQRLTYWITLSSIIVLGCVVGVPKVSVASVSEKPAFGGRLLMTQSSLKVWFTDQTTGFRYDVSKAAIFRRLIQRIAVLVTEQQLGAIPTIDSPGEGNAAIRMKYAGKIIVERGTVGPYWYVVPDLRARIDVSSISNVRGLAAQHGTKVDAKTLALWPIDPVVRSVATTIKTPQGAFSVKYVTINRINPSYRLMTDRTDRGICSPSTCGGNPIVPDPTWQCLPCRSQSMQQFVKTRRAVAGINGTYFFDKSYYGRDWSIFSIMNSFVPLNRQRWINNPWMKPAVFVDTSNRIFFDIPYQKCDTVWDKKQKRYITSIECTKNVLAQWSLVHGGTGIIQAMFNTEPALVFQRKNIVNNYFLDSKQESARTTRGIFGVKGSQIYLVVVKGATVPDAAAVATAMRLVNAVNLDGGGSTALYARGKFLAGPGRAIPNALLITP